MSTTAHQQHSSLSGAHGYFHEDPYLICPYDPAHTILKSRMQCHLVKCLRNHPHITKVACPFNTTHRLDAAEMAFHMSECPNSRVIMNFKYTVGKSSFPGPNLVPVQNVQIESEENWDDSNTPAYDPSARLKDGKLLVQLKGATPSERARFREERNVMYEKAVKSCSEESGIDPCVPPDHVSSKTDSSTIAQESLANDKNSTSGIESLAPDTETFYYRNKPLVDESTTESASFSAELPWMSKPTAKYVSSENSSTSACNPIRPSPQNKCPLFSDMTISSDVEQNTSASVQSACPAAMSSACNPIRPSPQNKWPLFSDMTISSDVEQNTSASVRSARTAAMSFSSKSASQASFTPKMAGRGDFRRANRDPKPGHGMSLFESTGNKIMKGRTAYLMALSNHHQPYNFNDFKAASSTSGKSESTYDPSHNEYHHEGMARPSNVAVRYSIVQPPPQPWADEDSSTDFWEPEASIASSPPRRVKNASGQVDYSLCGIGRGRRLDSFT